MLRFALSSIVVLALGIATAAQEGHPLTGTWYGDYGSGSQRIDLTIVMKWDGKCGFRDEMNPAPTPSRWPRP